MKSIRSLESLYSVIIGVALSLAIVGLVDRETGLQTITLSECVLFLAFIVTLVPFYHGAIRHLDDCYAERPDRDGPPGKVFVDFVLLFIHALGFVVLSMLLKQPGQFAWVLSILLLVDVFWGVFVFFSGTRSVLRRNEGRWALINTIFICSVVPMLVWRGIGLGDVAEPAKIAIPLLGICTIRTVTDYILCWGLYFPES